jgi:hypothetical protein
MNIPRFFFIALLGLGVPLIHAQEPAPAPTPAPVPAPDAGMKLRAISFMVDKPITGLFAHDPSVAAPLPGVPFQVKTYLNHEFSQVPVKGDSVIFTNSSEPASAKDPAKVLAKAKLPSGFKKGILIFLPGTGRPGDPAYRVLPMEDSLGSFPRGSVKVMNLSQSPVRIRLEKTDYEFKSGEMQLIKDHPVGDNNSASMMAFAFKDKEWQRVGAGVWAHPGEKRVIQIIFDNPKSHQVELAGIRDVAVRDN